ELYETFGLQESPANPMTLMVSLTGALAALRGGKVIVESVGTSSRRRFASPATPRSRPAGRATPRRGRSGLPKRRTRHIGGRIRCRYKCRRPPPRKKGRKKRHPTFSLLSSEETTSRAAPPRPAGAL